MDFRCDLYVYADVAGGYTIHVATRRSVDPPAFPEFPIDAPTDAALFEWAERYRAAMTALDDCEKMEIGLPADGKTFRLATAEDTAAKIGELRAMGYVMPDGLEDDILEDAEDEPADE